MEQKIKELQNCACDDIGDHDRSICTFTGIELQKTTERMCHIPDMDYHNCLDSSDCNYWGEDESGKGSDCECYFGEEDELSLIRK